MQPRFSAAFRNFLRVEADRHEGLRALVAEAGLAAGERLVPLAGRRHLLLRLGEGGPRIILAAHYDRHPGSPGYLDNSAACLQLLELGARLAAEGEGGRAGGPRGGGAAGAGRASGAGGPSGGRRGHGARSAFALLFTDGEEAPATEGPLAQGSFDLGRALRGAVSSAAETLGPAVLALDVTGRGDRLVLSTSSRELLSRGGREKSGLAAGQETLAARVDRAALRAGLERPVRLALPWSDDLGFTLAGLPALTLSLLPSPELQALRARGERPLTWEFLHKPTDDLALAEEEPYALMASFLDAFVSLPGAR